MGEYFISNTYVDNYIPYMPVNLLSPLGYSSKNLDHLGIVATVCKEIGLADGIDRIVGVDPRQKVTCGTIDKGRVETRGVQ